jgi:CHAT domain-containing protein
MVGLGALVCTVGACRPVTAPPTGRDALAEAVADTLPFQARLSGGFAPSKRGPTRAAGDRAPELSPDTRIAIALLEKRAIENPTPETQADLGVGYLVQGDIDRAISTIEDAASQMTAAGPWSDLSAAYLAKAERTPARRIEYLARALESAEKSLKIEKSNDALFNRALARDGLAPYTGAPAPWSEYAAAEKDPAWRDAAAHEANNDHPIDDGRDRWEARRKELSARLKANDAAFVRETVRLFPEASIEFLERDLLVDEKLLPAATLLASAIYETTRDSMMRDEVAVFRGREAALAQAHAAYARGVQQSDADDLANAQRSFLLAGDGFRRAAAPYRMWVEARLATIEWNQGKFAATLERLARIEPDARARGYNTLLGRNARQRGQVYTRQWRLTEGLAAFRESASHYEAAAEREYAVSVYASLADALRMLGEANESWDFIGRTLEDLPRVRGPVRRYLLLYNAALFARRQNLHEASLLFQDAAVREASKAGSKVLIEATIQRALANVRRGDQVQARADFDRAAQQVATTEAGPFRSYVSAELDIVRAQLAQPDQSVVVGLRDAIDFFNRTEPGRVPGLYLLLARVPGTQGTTEGALRAGIDKLESQQAGLNDEALRISYFDEAWTLFQDMVSLQVAARNPAAAFEFAERSRARSLLAATQGASASRTRSLADIQRQLPPSLAVVYYSTLPDRLLIWTITSSNSQLFERPIDERELARLITQQRETIRDRRERPANDRLYKLLIDPVAPSLSPSAVVVLVPDGPLQQLPFATLRHPATRRFLIEDHALMVTPSASFFVDARAAAVSRATGPFSSALLIGNPTTGNARALPGAEAEVETASRFYARREVLVGTTATKDRFLKMAPDFDVVHFGGHALANPEFPLFSRLVFADDAEGEQSLFAHEIAKVRFPRTRVVVLAACSTAAGTVSRGEGVVSVARPFLAGGVPLVVASQWDVDDRATEQLTMAFHRELAKTRDPIHALQSAQLAMLRSGDPVQMLPESWGAFIAVGTTAQ